MVRIAIALTQTLAFSAERLAARAALTMLTLDLLAILAIVVIVMDIAMGGRIFLRTRMICCDDAHGGAPFWLARLLFRTRPPFRIVDDRPLLSIPAAIRKRSNEK